MTEILTIENLNTLTALLLNIPFLGEYLPIIFGIVTVASAIAALTDTPEEDTLKFTLYKYLIDLPGLNIFKAKK